MKSIYIPGGSTAYNQPLDRSMMKSFKSAIARKASRHFAARFLKPVIAKWVHEVINDISSRREIFETAWAHILPKNPEEAASVLLADGEAHAAGSLFRSSKADVVPETAPVDDEPEQPPVQKMRQSSAVSSWTKKKTSTRGPSHTGTAGAATNRDRTRANARSPNYQPLFWSTATCRCWSGASSSGSCTAGGPSHTGTAGAATSRDWTRANARVRTTSPCFGAPQLVGAGAVHRAQDRVRQGPFLNSAHHTMLRRCTTFQFFVCHRKHVSDFLRDLKQDDSFGCCHAHRLLQKNVCLSRCQLSASRCLFFLSIRTNFLVVFIFHDLSHFQF